ncbi:MAG: M16 family metallopeptidase [Hyphomicrobiales bacterium]
MTTSLSYVPAPGRVLAVWLAVVGIALGLTVRAAEAVEIQQITTDKGITAWLVEEHSIPLIAARIAFRGGAALDPEDKQGLASVLSGMLDEGAGDLDSQAFQTALKKIAVRISFNAGRDNFYGRFQTLSRNKDEAFELLRLAINEPRFDEDPLARIKSQLTEALRRQKNDPQTVAVRTWMSIAFRNHPYARNPEGTIEGISAVVADDLRNVTKRLFAKDKLVIAVVGDIDAATLKTLLDKAFGDLPDKAETAAVPEALVATGPVRTIVDMDIPQSVIQFGHVGIKRNDPDFIPAYVMNHVLGGGGLTSRLTEEVREKRGLTYSVYSYLSPFNQAGLFLGGAATQNERAGEALDIIERELRRMAEDGPTADELAATTTYLTGSYALRFDTSTKIAGQLLGIQLENLGADYIEKRNSLIEAVTQDDVKRVARRLLKPDSLIVTVVGQPKGIETLAAPTE